MRHLAMAGDVPPLEAHTILGWLSGLATATVGALGLWMAQRVLGKAAFQTSMNDGFAKLNDRLQVQLDKQAETFEAERKMFAAERIAWADEKAQFKGRIRQLEQQVQSLLNERGESRANENDAEPGATQI